jgi:hypothetical protein
LARSRQCSHQRADRTRDPVLPRNRSAPWRSGRDRPE